MFFLLIIIHYITSICHPNRDENKNKKKSMTITNNFFKYIFIIIWILFCLPKMFFLLLFWIYHEYSSSSTVFMNESKNGWPLLFHMKMIRAKKKNPSTRTHNVNWNPITIFFWWWCCVRVTIITINSND